MNKTIILLPFLLVFISCSDSEKIENVKLHYNNGKIYCVGKHRIESGRFFSGDEKFSIGIWNFFHPNGKIHLVLSHNEDGEIIDAKEYSYDGNILRAYSKKNNSMTVSRYFPNGKLRFEDIYDKNEYDEDGEDVFTNIDEKDYYENGVLKSHRHNKQLLIWDSIGTELIKIKYDDNGCIITEK